MAATRHLVVAIRHWKPQVVNAWLLDATVSARFARLFHPSLPLLVSLANADYEPETIAMAKWPPRRVAVLRAIDTAASWLARPQFVACSQFVAGSAARHLHLPAHRIRTIYNSVDLNTLQSPPTARLQLRQEFNIAADALVFLNVGRLDPQKGQSLLLRAFAPLTVSNPNVLLAIVGGGPLESTLRSLAVELGIASRVRFLGVRNDVGSCLAMSDVFVFPSLFEGFGIALVEAMAKGLPCIAGRVGPIPEIVRDQDTGLLANTNSVTDLSAAMCRLADDGQLRRSLGERGKIAANRFASTALMPQWESLYEDLALKRIK
jgi:glycosyltransferase involved in cell wall biosynthesis